MKKILVFTSLFGKPFYGGAESSVFEFYQSLTDERHQIVVCTLDKKYSNQVYVELTNLQLKRFTTFLPHPIMERNRTNFVTKIFSHILNISIGLRPLTVVKEFTRLRPDLVITHNLSGWGMLPWIMCRVMGIPLIHDSHDFYLNCFKTTMWKSKQGVCKKTCKSCTPRSLATTLFWGGGLLLSNSIFLQESTKKLLTNKKHTDYKVIYPPIKINPEAIKTSQIEYDAVFIGRLEDSKGITEFLNSTKFTKYKIAVAGVGELMFQLKKDFPGVDFLGQVDSFELMAKSRLIVVPSKNNETFGRVVVEAVAMGLPVLHSNRGGLSEFKERKGATLIEIDPENTSDISSQLELAIKFEKNLHPVNVKWLEEHYEDQLSRFRAAVNDVLTSNENI
jgi:glycosyltransferase involved in cell wall biosynthesis